MGLGSAGLGELAAAAAGSTGFGVILGVLLGLFLGALGAASVWAAAAPRGPPGTTNAGIGPEDMLRRLRTKKEEEEASSSSSASLLRERTLVPARSTSDWGLSTRLVHGGVQPDPSTGAILTPVYQATTFVHASVEEYLAKGFTYSRTSNPTVRALEDKICLVEGGLGATCFATGMAAISALLSALLKPGDHVVMSSTCYGGTLRLAKKHFAKFGVDFSFVDASDLALVERAIRPGKTRLIFTESPANPTLKLTDVAAVSRLSHRHGALHCCDATFATPVIMRPFELGADIVLHSLTKFFDGHNCTVAGAVVVRTQELHDALQFHMKMLGSSLHAHTAFLILQFMKTLEVRVLRQCETALKVATTLEADPRVERVVYAGLESFPQRALALKQHRKGAHGSMLWLEIAGGAEAATRFVNALQRPWSLCESLGACESMVTLPSVMTHASMSREDRLEAGITDGLVRLSCGVEDAEDLIQALQRALDRI